VVAKTAYTGRRVLGMLDCLWGLLDEVNDAGLAVSLPPTRQPEFSGLVRAFFFLLEDQPADLEVQLLGVGEEIDIAQRLILAR
jgi:hypothetical protein